MLHDLLAHHFIASVVAGSAICITVDQTVRYFKRKGKNDGIYFRTETSHISSYCAVFFSSSLRTLDTLSIFQADYEGNA